MLRVLSTLDTAEELNTEATITTDERTIIIEAKMAEKTVRTTTAKGRDPRHFQRGRGNYSRGIVIFQRNNRSNGRKERSPTQMRTYCITCGSNNYTARDDSER